jgi:hypothetical protein
MCELLKIGGELLKVRVELTEIIKRQNSTNLVDARLMCLTLGSGVTLGNFQSFPNVLLRFVRTFL